MDGYKVPKDQAKVILKAPPAAPVERYTFLSEFAEHHQGGETVSDLLARPKRFLPFRSEDGGAALIRKQAIAWLMIMEPERVEWYFYESRLGVPAEAVRVVFADGEELRGRIYAVAPEGRRRVQDLMNDAEGFLHLETAEGLFLVNLDHVLSVHSEGDDHGRA